MLKEAISPPQSGEQLAIWGSLDNGTANKLAKDDKAFHDWYRFVLSFPPHLVRGYIDDFGLGTDATVLDPFCGTGTTVVEAKLSGLIAIGIEANPMAHFAGTVKLDWSVDPDLLFATAEQIVTKVEKRLKTQGINDSLHFTDRSTVLKTVSPELHKLLLTNSISPLPMHKVLMLIETIDEYKKTESYSHLRLALAKALVFSISNLRFGPEVGVGKIVEDKPVLRPWLTEVKKISVDLRSVDAGEYQAAKIIHGDARQIQKLIAPRSIDAVITSPPYPNEKDYSRTTRLESVLLGFIDSKEALREVKKSFVRSNTRSVYKADDDDAWISNTPEVKQLAARIEARRIELGKTSGFEKLYARVTELYFGGMAKHLDSLKPLLKPGAMLGYVVGDQASYFQVLIPTGQILGQIAEKLGYELVRIDLFRTRFATATKQELREEVVILRWPGHVQK
ncbi:site-specific DNA-methyltransferase [Spirosoma sp. RP8]|uniref:site-specific DNA-methyltransferase (cytosine-N(4)-specific) n=1 Tax=Spirosoma liriopis TaxID=2937440 RepID=A0ABT0HW25_9BACT|nr:DNA methyltransferase [Spirosoma liriopis]MCK8496072.1 site-specific DNA-methyltransferase [Spirosoma liriopis]